MTTRDRTVLAVVLVAAALGAFWFLALSPKRKEAADVSTQVSQRRQELDTAKGQLSTARAAKADYASNYATVARLGQAVPADDDVPSLVFQVESAARAAHVDFRAVKLTGQSSSSTAPTATAQATPTGGSSSTTGSSTSTTTGSTSTTTSTTTGSSSASSTTGSSASGGSTAGGASAGTTSGAPATQAASATLPPGAAIGPAGFPTMPFALTFDGSFFHMAGFFHRLQRFVDGGGRTLKVRGRLLTLDGFSLTASRKGFPKVTASIAATAYLVPDETVPAGATPGAPGTTSASPASGSSASPGAPATDVTTPGVP